MKRYQTYLFDLDGTIYLGDALIPGVEEAIESLLQGGANVRYVTNNPTRARGEYAQKLTSLGIPTASEQVVTSVEATVSWLTSNEPQAVVYPIGEEPLHEALAKAGIKTSENAEEIDIVLASYDRTFTYAKLQIAFDAIWYHQRARLMSTNPDRYCPYPGGRGEPDAAAIVGAIEASTGVQLVQTFGKPSGLLASMALAGVETPGGVSECLMIGDRLHTDIAMGIAAGMDTALVLTGDSTREEIESSGIQPKYVLPSVAELI